MFPRGSEGRVIISTKNNKYTVIGVTLLTGAALMCVIILKGTDVHAHDCSGIDVFAEPVGDTSDRYFVKKNTGKGKIYPGGPECTYKG